MKLWKFLGMATLSGLLFASCKNPVYVQRDQSVNLSNYHTYMWVETRANDHDGSPRATAYADVSVRNAVNEGLSKEGWKEVSSNPDVLLSYDVLVHRTTEEQSNPVYTTPFTRMYYNPYRGHWGTIYYPSQFVGYETYDKPVKEGTITITMTDAQTDKVVWQAWTTEQLNYARLTPEEINKSVRNIFNKFDVASR
jgi:hypothetical protein